jgi:hypothetical protein
MSHLRPYKIRRPERFSRYRKSLLLRMKRHPYAVTIKDALLRYNNALDKTDYDAGIVELWSVLESITGVENARYDDVVRRASFPWSDNAWARALLSHLRHYRNRSVHDGRSSAHRNEAIHFLRRFVEALLMFHWRNSIGAMTLAEACEFLHLEPNAAKLERRIELLQRAVKFITPKEQPQTSGSQQPDICSQSDEPIPQSSQATTQSLNS